MSHDKHTTVKAREVPNSAAVSVMAPAIAKRWREYTSQPLLSVDVAYELARAAFDAYCEYVEGEDE